MAQEQMNSISRQAAADRSGNAVVWGVVVVIVIAAAAAWYFYMPLPVPAPAEDNATKTLETQSSSDDVNAIDQDLQQTDLNDLDKELSDINTAL